MKILAIGDIHTKMWVLDKVEELASRYDKVIFIGDYSDDWDSSPIESVNAWKRIKNMHNSDKEKFIFLTGNHDYSYVNSLDVLSSGYNGMTQALLNTPENKILKEWVRNLPISVVEDGITYSHAGYTEEWVSSNSDDLWTDGSPLWARPNSSNYSSRRQYLPNQVFGHTPNETCWEVEPNVWCIDSFSTERDGTPIGDCTVLEIIDGKEFNKVNL